MEEDNSRYELVGMSSILAFMWRIDKSAPIRLVSCVDATMMVDQQADRRVNTRYGCNRWHVCNRYPNRSNDMILALRRKHANMIEPVQEHSTCASGSQNSNGYVGVFAAMIARRRRLYIDHRGVSMV